MRFYNTTTKGSTFNAFTIHEVWNKARIVPGYNPASMRKDSCGALIAKSEYGNIHSTYGWEIDHIKPVSRGGSDFLFNLQPLQWANNRHKSDNWPNWSCKLRAA